MINKDELKKLLHYAPETGVFTWIKKGQRRPSKIGDIAGYIGERYVVIGVERHYYPAHRLAWLYMTGAFPEIDIDHIDGNGLNNAWVNLRQATVTQNRFNSKVSRKSKTGLKGAYLHKPNGKYVARTVHEGKRVLLGYFETALEAKAAYDNFHKTNKNQFYKA